MHWHADRHSGGLSLSNHSFVSKFNEEVVQPLSLLSPFLAMAADPQSLITGKTGAS